MPIDEFEGGERPLHRVPGQAGLNMSILGYVGVVVVIDEWMVADRVVERNRRNRQNKSQNPGSPLVRSKYTSGAVEIEFPFDSAA